MRRFFVEKIEKPSLNVYGNERKHLADVLRARVGDKVILCPNDGNDYVYKIVGFDKNSVSLNYVSENKNETEPELMLTVFASLLKGDKTELVVQKLTELGVKRITPFISDYTVQKSKKNERLKRSAHEASKQCGRAIIPEVTEIVSFDQMLKTLDKYDTVVFAYEDAYTSGKRLSDVIKGNEKTIALVVGPEGGFSEREVNALTLAGYEPVTLGKRILRAETASIAGASVIMCLAGEWS
ncbi:MAG: 16S rRNA (uracil(1498)-N(3))-methyltransferase [Clostridia bacterium]|nr:16S rRNA (uracil(1498)-N(3))-methyltransferase [Clostridia bacterium]